MLVGIDQFRMVGLRLVALGSECVAFSREARLELTRSGRWNCDFVRSLQVGPLNSAHWN